MCVCVYVCVCVCDHQERDIISYITSFQTICFLLLISRARDTNFSDGHLEKFTEASFFLQFTSLKQSKHPYIIVQNHVYKVLSTE